MWSWLGARFSYVRDPRVGANEKLELGLLLTRRLVHLYIIKSEEHEAKTNIVVSIPPVPLQTCWGVEEIPLTPSLPVHDQQDDGSWYLSVKKMQYTQSRVEIKSTYSR